ncbi:MAG TPA: HD domain-containing protein [Gemmatimonadaceae bacterium]|nr:HD domain-containing protein [Gemmatimonadaceae bacterium]
MPPINLPRLAPGARVHHELRVVSRDNRKTRDGKPFIVLTLGNCHGDIAAAPIWSDKLFWADGAERGSIVQAIGEISTYDDGSNKKRQLELTAPLRRVDTSLVTLDDFLPRVEDDVTVLWGSLDRMRAEIRSATLRTVLGTFFDDDVFREEFERWPGSTRGHHAKLGGLLRHVVEVTSIGRSIARAMRAGGRTTADVDLVTAGALLHDVGKLEAYAVSPGGFDTTPRGHLLGHIVLGTLMLERRVARLHAGACSDEQLLELHHLILSHHGTLEFGSPVRPMTVEAEIVHWADESSAKASSFCDAIADPSIFPEQAEISDRVWMLDNRRIWQKPHSWD